MKKIKAIIVTILTIGFSYSATAHPASGIIVDKYGNVYFIYSRNSVIKISSDGKLTYVHKNNDGHWICLDEQGFFSRTQPKYFERITPDGTVPAIIFAGGGSPIVVNKDGNFYYCGGPNGDLNPGALTLVRETPQKQQTIFSPHLEDTLEKLDDGITALSAAPDGSLYVGCWNSLLKVSMDGKVKTLLHPIVINDCDEDPADHKAENRDKPLLRGLAIDSSGTVYAAATSCHCLLNITRDGKVKTILKSERPWCPTGVAIHNGSIYVLEYTNANGPATEGWYPRVRKIDKSGSITTIADLSPKEIKSISKWLY
jgi:hypothetical protein